MDRCKGDVNFLRKFLLCMIGEQLHGIEACVSFGEWKWGSGISRGRVAENDFEVRIEVSEAACWWAVGACDEEEEVLAGLFVHGIDELPEPDDLRGV